jgi:hypothetical protein
VAVRPFLPPHCAFLLTHSLTHSAPLLLLPVGSRDAFYLSFAEGSRPLAAAPIADQSVQRSNLCAAAPQPQPHKAAAGISTAPVCCLCLGCVCAEPCVDSSAGLDTDLKLCADNVQELVGYVHSQFQLLVLDVQFCDEPESIQVMSANERCRHLPHRLPLCATHTAGSGGLLLRHVVRSSKGRVHSAGRCASNSSPKTRCSTRCRTEGGRTSAAPRSRRGTRRAVRRRSAHRTATFARRQPPSEWIDTKVSRKVDSMQ